MLREETIIVASDSSLWPGPDVPEGGAQITAIVDDEGRYWQRLSAAKAMLTDQLNTAVEAHIGLCATPEVQQIMALSGARLSRKATLDSSEQAKLEAIDTVESWILSVRQAGLVISAALQTATTADALNVVDDPLPPLPDPAVTALAATP